MTCWMCDREKYVWLEHQGSRVCRLVDEDEHAYVIVPRESHVKHHLLVVLKANEEPHKQGLIECTADDLRRLATTISRWCDVLKRYPYDTVYTACYSDEGHVHFHLIPLNHARDKGYSGKAMQWLAEKERLSDAKPFAEMSDADKKARLMDIESLVAELRRGRVSRLQANTL